MTAAVTTVMAPKEDQELSYIKKAAGVTTEVFSKYLKEQIMDIIDNDRKVKHAKMSEGVEKAIGADWRLGLTWVDRDWQDILSLVDRNLDSNYTAFHNVEVVDFRSQQSGERAPCAHRSDLNGLSSRLTPTPPF